jgi:hypothetical protein
MYWAYGEKDIQSTQIDQIRFKSKGFRSIYLLNPSFKKPKDVSQWDVTMRDVKITEQYGSLYWCKIFKAPEENGKHHIIGEKFL